MRCKTKQEEEDSRSVDLRVSSHAADTKVEARPAPV